MRYNRSATPLERVQVEPIGANVATVWLRQEVNKTTEDGQDFWETFSEVEGVVSPIPTEEEIEEAFDAWFERLGDEMLTDAEKLEKLEAQVLFTALMTETEV